MQTSTQASAIDLYRELVMLDCGEGRTTARRVAVKFEKSHTHALRKLDQVVKAVGAIEPEMAALMFRESIYTDTRGRPQREVLINHDGFMMLAMRFSGDKATRWQLKFIAAFKWLAMMVREREENHRLMAQFEIKDRASIEAGSYHGTGLQRRKVEKEALCTERQILESAIQPSLLN